MNAVDVIYVPFGDVITNTKKFVVRFDVTIQSYSRINSKSVSIFLEE